MGRELDLGHISEVQPVTFFSVLILLLERVVG